MKGGWLWLWRILALRSGSALDQNESFCLDITGRCPTSFVAVIMKLTVEEMCKKDLG